MNTMDAHIIEPQTYAVFSCLYLAIGPASDEFHNSISIEVKSMDAHGMVFWLHRKEDAYLTPLKMNHNSVAVFKNDF